MVFPAACIWPQALLWTIALGLPTTTTGNSSTTGSSNTGADSSLRTTNALSGSVTSAAASNASVTASITGPSSIPGLVEIDCADPPCIAFCSAGNTPCISAVQSIVATCQPQWAYYQWMLRTGTTAPPGWSTVTKVEGLWPSTVTTLTSIWTTFSTASEVFTRKDASNITRLTTFTPEYAVGSPSVDTLITTLEDYRQTYTKIDGPKPSCRYNVLETTYSDCGQCTLIGGTVDLYFWPSTTATVANTAAASTVINGATLYSPSAYIHLRTVYASDSCTQVGQRYHATFLAMDPEDITTQVHFGGKVYQSGANSYGKLNYADLTGLPPASNYEMQPDCIMFGCPTIYPSSWNPVLVVPTQLRHLDPAWQSCVVGLDGLYDPPVQLTPQATMAKPTILLPYTTSATPPYAQATTSIAAPTSTTSRAVLHAPTTVAFTEVIPSATAIDSTLSRTSVTLTSSSQADSSNAVIEGVLVSSSAQDGPSTMNPSDPAATDPSDGPTSPEISSSRGPLSPEGSSGTISPELHQPSHGLSSSAPPSLSTDTENVDTANSGRTSVSSTYSAGAFLFAINEPYTTATAAITASKTDSTANALEPTTSPHASDTNASSLPTTSSVAYTSRTDGLIATSLPVLTFDSLSNSAQSSANTPESTQLLVSSSAPPVAGSWQLWKLLAGAALVLLIP